MLIHFSEEEISIISFADLHRVTTMQTYQVKQGGRLMYESLDPVARIILGCLTLIVLAAALMFPIREDRKPDEEKPRDSARHS